jgi:catechol 2,3-dioxygenase-like lactoylglutathione lyase family enzyme
MTLSLSHCFIYVLDQDAALRFYRDALGLEVRTDASMDDFRWLTVGPPGQPDVEIALLAPTPPPIPPDDVETMKALIAKGTLPGVLFATEDCRASFEQVRATGAEVLQEPIEQSYGVVDCAFRDPSGNMVRLSQPLPARASG